ncbi:3843_t:CDS:2 [Ambispora gerdemannii]|uniref:3843_t:CDS:1 n=1 Tax=Ambispora gerdemannii TaxID=144530 RepID=A0A9N9GT81_9GLOM|nr:3843_t:CDS:2 [Ambispora gerdemannii]
METQLKKPNSFDYLNTKAFIETQIFLLSKEFEPSSRWFSAKTSIIEEKIPPNVINEVVLAVNISVRKQCSETFNQQAVNHLLEQIFLLHGERGREEVASQINIDITETTSFGVSTWILSLPEEWPAHNDHSPEIIERHSKHRLNLVNLHKKIMETKQKYEYLKHLREQLSPLYNTHAIQQNLVDRKGSVATELNKMLVLMPKLLMTIEKNKNFLMRKRPEISFPSLGSLEDESKNDTTIIVKGIIKDSGKGSM